MIREYNQTDVDEIIELLNLHNELSKKEQDEKRQELKNGKDILLVYEDHEKIQGISSINIWNNADKGSPWPSSATIIIVTRENSDFYAIADMLWEKSYNKVKDKDIAFIQTYYNEKQQGWRAFYDKKGFEQWFGIRGMIYKGNRFSPTKLTYRNYEDKDFNMYYTYLGQCFSPMRQANDIHPFNIYEGSSSERIERLKRETLEKRDSIYLFYEGKQFIGSSIVEEEIDDIFVIPEKQGKGYGQKIVEATINLALDRDFSKITLGAVAWNKVAIKLYESIGFEIYQSFEHRRLVVKKD